MDNKAIDRGYAFDHEFEMQKADRTPQVVDGTTAVWRLAASPDELEPLIEKALTPVSVSGKTLARLTLTAAETGLLTGKQYYHQLAVTLSDDGEPRIHFAGWIQVQDRL